MKENLNDYSSRLDNLNCNENYRIMVGNRIRDLIKARGLSYAQAAEGMGINASTLNNYIQGTRSPRMPQLQAIAKFLHVSPGYLTDGIVQPSDQYNGLSAEAYGIACKFDHLDEQTKRIIRLIVETESRQPWSNPIK